MVRHSITERKRLMSFEPPSLNDIFTGPKPLAPVEHVPTGIAALDAVLTAGTARAACTSSRVTPSRPASAGCSNRSRCLSRGLADGFDQKAAPVSSDSHY